MLEGGINLATRRGPDVGGLAVAALRQNLQVDLIFVQVELFERRVDGVVDGGTSGFNACHVSSPCPGRPAAVDG